MPLTSCSWLLVDSRWDSGPNSSSFPGRWALPGLSRAWHVVLFSDLQVHVSKRSLGSDSRDMRSLRGMSSSCHSLEELILGQARRENGPSATSAGRPCMPPRKAGTSGGLGPRVLSVLAERHA